MLNNKLGIVFQSEAFQKDFKKLYKLSVKNIKLLASDINTDEGFAEIDEDWINRSVERLRIDLNHLKDILDISKFIYNTILRKELDSSDVKEAILEYVKHISLEPKKSKIDALAKLFDIKQLVREDNKIKPFRKSILPNITGISTVQDFRAVFSGDDNADFECFLPMCIIRIRTKTDHNKEKEYVFQVSRYALDWLIDSLKKEQIKLSEIAMKYQEILPFAKERKISISEENKK
ncbi:MAG: hypothetical protein HQ568_05140 [Calditrichaeota bacterium]|nr:hypothetical protein [Calditrichota bacterium]